MAGLAAGESIVVPDKMLKDAGINVVVDEVTKIDPEKKEVYTAGGKGFQYDKLYLATGSRPFIPPIEGKDLEGVVSLRGLGDAEKIKTFLSEKQPENIVFIGAGFISMEIASLLMENMPGKFNISIVELMDRPLPLMLDKDMADLVTEYLTEKGLNILTGEKVEKILGNNGKVSGVALESGKKIGCRHGICKCGS